MGQNEIYNLLLKKQRLTSREIAEELNINIEKVCKLINKMLNKEIKVVNPTEEEIEKLLKKYPTLKFAPKSHIATNRIKVFVLIE